MPKVWAVTGVSGSGRIEMLNELKDYAEKQGKKVRVIDVGEVIREKAKKNQVGFVLERILNLDRLTLAMLRALAIQSIKHDIEKDGDSDIVFIGMHALFLWKSRLIPGVSYSDLMSLDLEGIITVVDDVLSIMKANKNNQKWKNEERPDATSLQRWMMEEELLSDVFASIKGVQMFVMARSQKVENLYRFFFEEKKHVYLSFPITAIRHDPELLEKIQTGYKERLEKLFYVYNPLDIKDKTHVSSQVGGEEGLLEKTSSAMVDARTIDRDYRFISQSDAVVVIYPTDKLSHGVSAEMSFAYSHQIPVFILYEGSVSPFLKEISTVFDKEEEFFAALESFSKKTGHDGQKEKATIMEETQHEGSL